MNLHSLALTSSESQKAGSDLSAPLVRRLFFDGVWAFAGKAITALLVVTANVFLTRLLTPEEVGAYFLTLSLVSVAALIAQLGLNQAVVRLVAESLGVGRMADARVAVRMIFCLAGLGAIVVAGVLVLGIGQILAKYLFGSLWMEKVIPLAAVWLVVVSLQNLLAESFRGFRDIRLASLFGGLVMSALSVLLFALLWIIQGRSNLNQIVILSIVAGLTSTLAAGWMLHRKLGGLQGEAILKVKDVLVMAWPLLVTNLTLFALTQADLWIVGAFRSQAEVALYGAAARLTILVVLPLVIVNAVVQPVIAEMYAQGKKEELEQILRSTAALAAIPAFVLSAGFVFLSGPVLGWLYGPYYRMGAIVLTVLGIGQFINVWAGSCGLTLMMTGHEGTMMAITLACGLATVALGIGLVGGYGYVGVAVAAALGLAIQNVVMWLCVRWKTGMWTHMGIIKLLSVMNQARGRQ